MSKQNETLDNQEKGNSYLGVVISSLRVNDIAIAFNAFRDEQLPEAESPFHHEAEIWQGMKYFLLWLNDKKQ